MISCHSGKPRYLFYDFLFLCDLTAGEKVYYSHYVQTEAKSLV
jgi:hypothetical protein